MKSILVCDDYLDMVEAIKVTTRHLAEKVEIVITTNLPELLKEAASGKKFDAIFLDGHLRHGENTLPFLAELKAGNFPHLKETVIYLVSLDDGMQMRQVDMIGDSLKVIRHEKRRVVDEIYHLAEV